MMKSVTSRFSRWLVVLLGVLLWTGQSALAQAPAELGDEFIFFVNGKNVLIPEMQGSAVTDPFDPENTVARFAYANWAASGFRFSRTEGIDMTGNVSEEVGEGDTLYLKLLVDPANAGMPSVSLTFFDKTDDSPASDGTADLEFRLHWPIPEDLRDGQWHDLAIPLPPSTSAALDSAKVGKKADGSPLDVPLDDAAANWTYGGAWSPGAFGVWTAAEELWEEFQWGGVNGLTVFWDNQSGGGPIYLDDVYIGGPGTDVSAATSPPSAMSGINVETDGPDNLISWTPNPEFGAYAVYASLSEITDVDADEVLLIATVPFDAEEFVVRHEYKAPHASLLPLELHYAVTSQSLFGVENKNVSNSEAHVNNANLETQPFIIQLTEQEANTIFDNLSAGDPTPEGFPDGLQPFVLNSETYYAADVATLPDDDSDLSAQLWMAYSDLNELFIYGEVTDNALQFGGEAQSGGELWNFDSIEFGWGNYDLREVPGGGLLKGSPHEDYGRGEFPDYQFRISNRGGDQFINTSTFVSATLNGQNEGEIQGGGTVSEPMTDGAGNVIGYRFLTLIPMDAIQFEATGDVVKEPPASDEIRFMPFIIAINDADGNNREHQVVTSSKAIGGQWWNTPAQWEVIAMAGRELANVANEGEPTVPGTYALAQNYPNPFNPETTIRFELAKAERVTLSVFNLLGQQVATLVDGQLLAGGRHDVRFDARQLASGVYFYRLEAGVEFTQTKQMLLIK